MQLKCQVRKVDDENERQSVNRTIIKRNKTQAKIEQSWNYTIWEWQNCVTYWAFKMVTQFTQYFTTRYRHFNRWTMNKFAELRLRFLEPHYWNILRFICEVYCTGENRFAFSLNLVWLNILLEAEDQNHKVFYVTVDFP